MGGEVPYIVRPINTLWMICSIIGMRDQATWAGVAECAGNSYHLSLTDGNWYILVQSICKEEPMPFVRTVLFSIVLVALFGTACLP